MGRKECFVVSNLFFDVSNKVLGVVEGVFEIFDKFRFFG